LIFEKQTVPVPHPLARHVIKGKKIVFIGQQNVIYSAVIVIVVSHILAGFLNIWEMVSP
jgi:hypothetical protein